MSLRTWLQWFGRGAERDQAYARVTAMKQGYGDLGAQVISLSRRTDFARQSTGSTQRAFDFVERAFADATGQYALVGELIQSLEAGLAEGRIGDYREAESALKATGPKLTDLARQLDVWADRWRQVPLDLKQAEASMNRIHQQLQSAEARLGESLPLGKRFATMTQHLEKARQTLTGGNPVEAQHLLADLNIALKKAQEEVNRL